MAEHLRSIALTVNREEVRETVEARTSLVDFLRERLGLTGSHVGCEQGVCGACTVRLDGVIVRGCLVLAAQCAGTRVETIEGMSEAGEIADLQEAFVRRNALQCGFCTPGMLLSAQELLSQGGVPSRADIRAHLSGNYCRCTGYQAIVDAVEAVARARANRHGAASPSPQSKSAVADFDHSIDGPNPAYTRFRLGEGGGSRSCGPEVPHSPTPDPSPAEPRYSEGSANQKSDRSRQQPTSVGGGGQEERAGRPRSGGAL